MTVVVGEVFVEVTGVVGSLKGSLGFPRRTEGEGKKDVRERHRVLLYGAPVFVDAIKIPYRRAEMANIQQNCHHEELNRTRTGFVSGGA